MSVSYRIPVVALRFKTDIPEISACPPSAEDFGDVETTIQQKPDMITVYTLAGEFVFYVSSRLEAKHFWQQGLHAMRHTVNPQRQSNVVNPVYQQYTRGLLRCKRC